MWDEEINKKIKDAADQYHPAYDDTAWNNMEKLLDEHLPQKKDRRRIIYLISLILMLTGLLLFVNYDKRSAPVVPVAKTGKKPLLKDEGNLPSPHSRYTRTVTANHPDQHEKGAVTGANGKISQSKEMQSNLAKGSTSGIADAA